jgi:hypothetical protein
MDKIRTISIKHERLRKIRNNLRYVIRTRALDKRKELSEQLSTFRQKKYKGEITEEEFWKIRKKISDDSDDLLRALRKSICKCSICHSYISDMIYIPRFEKWYCVDCAADRGWAKEPELKEKLTMTRAQIRHFLIALDGILEHKPCRTDHRYARQVLYQIGIEPEQQEIFLELCKINGGYCDCEIIMNAAPELRKLRLND